MAHAHVSEFRGGGRDEKGRLLQPTSPSHYRGDGVPSNRIHWKNTRSELPVERPSKRQALPSPGLVQEAGLRFVSI